MNTRGLAVDEHTMPTYKRWPIEIVSGSGCNVTDSEGRTYLDLVAGIAVASVGHSHPHVVNAIATQASQLIHVSNLYGTQPQAELAGRLAELLPGSLSFFANSGAEAIECALKLARKWGRRHKGEGATEIVAAEGGFHGRTFGALSATGQPAKRAPFEPCVPGFTHVPYGDVEALAEAMTADTAAVLLEPIQGEAGIVVPPPDYLRAARALCDHHGALLILDEIQTGLGRTGRMFGHDGAGVAPDVVCLGKALAGGLPMSACLATEQVAVAFEPGDHATTFGGGPVQSAAALAVLDVIETERLVERAETAGTMLMEGLAKIVPEGAVVRGRGLMIGIALPAPDASDLTQKALRHGLLINNATPDVLRLVPPLVIGDAEIEAALWGLEEVFA
jgi:acetylornithine/N-succinyldiaminopimelate aminotransferase